MASNKDSRVYLWVFFLLGLVGLLVTYIAVTVLKSDLLSAISLAFGSTLLTSIVIFVLERSIPRDAPKIEILRGHFKIYHEYQKHIRGLSSVPHRIWTISSSSQISKEWDDFLVGYLNCHGNVIYSRVLVMDDNPSWAGRIADIKARYGGLLNYQHRATVGPPSIECLIIDDSHAFITFASGPAPQECAGILIRDATICQELQHYFVNKLENVLPPQPLGDL